MRPVLSSAILLPGPGPVKDSSKVTVVNGRLHALRNSLRYAKGGKRSKIRFMALWKKIAIVLVAWVGSVLVYIEFKAR